MADLHGEGLMKDGEFQEHEVWAVEQGVEESVPNAKKTERLKRHTKPPSLLSLSSANQQQQEKQKESSGPMRIPDWKKIYRETTEDSSHGCCKEVDDVNSDDEMMPPHEYINRRLAGNQIGPFSMCEGVGRTLKGRDLSEMRNAILTKTGFLE